MTTFKIYKKLDQYEDYKLEEKIEREDTPETRQDLIDEYFDNKNDWDIEDDEEEFVDGEVDEIYFYRTSVPRHDWEKHIEGYIEIEGE